MPMPESHTAPALSHLCGIFYLKVIKFSPNILLVKPLLNLLNKRYEEIMGKIHKFSWSPLPRENFYFLTFGKNKNEEFQSYALNQFLKRQVWLALQQSYVDQLLNCQLR